MQTRISRVTRVFLWKCTCARWNFCVRSHRCAAIIIIIIIWKIARYLKIKEYISFSSVYELIFSKKK